jgi:hypothetical protein
MPRRSATAVRRALPRRSLEKSRDRSVQVHEHRPFLDRFATSTAVCSWTDAVRNRCRCPADLSPARNLASVWRMEFDIHQDHPRELVLTAHRAPGASVWDRRGWDAANREEATRWLLALGGGALALAGLRRRGFVGSLFAGLGGSLVWWSVGSSESFLTACRRIDSAFTRRRYRDPVNEALDDSFPASDAPSFTPTVGTGVRPETRPR